MAGYVVKIAKSGGDTKDVKDKAAHQAVAAETAAREAAVSAEASARAEAVSAEATAREAADADLKKAQHEEGTRSHPLIDTGNIFTEVGYISPQGYNQINDNFRRTPYIAVHAGDKFNFTKLVGNADVVGIWVFYNLAGVCQSALTSTGSYQTGTFTAPTDGYVRFSTNKTYLENGDASVVPHSKTQKLYGVAYDSERLNGTNASKLKKISWENGVDAYRLISAKGVLVEYGYINQSGYEQDNANFLRSNYIPVRAGEQFSYANLWGNSGNVGVIVIYDKDQTVLDVVVSTGQYQSGTVTLEQDGYIRFSTLKTYVDDGTTAISKVGNADFATNFLIYRMNPDGLVVETIGDSITEQYGLNPDQTWQGMLKNTLGFKTIYNHGVGGSTVSALNNGMCTDERIEALNNCSLLIVMGGVNDWVQNVDMGEQTYENENTSTFFGACNVMFRKMASNFKYTRIVAFGCTYACFPNREGWTDETGLKNNRGLLSVDYSAAMMKSAQMNGIEHYDIGGNLSVNISNIAEYFNDGTFYIHPGAVGRTLIAGYMAKMLC